MYDTEFPPLCHPTNQMTNAVGISLSDSREDQPATDMPSVVTTDEFLRLLKWQESLSSKKDKVSSAVKANQRTARKRNDYLDDPKVIALFGQEYVDELKLFRDEINFDSIKHLSVYEMFPFMKTYEQDYGSYVQQLGKEEADKMIETHREYEVIFDAIQARRDRIESERRRIQRLTKKVDDLIWQFTRTTESGSDAPYH